MNYRMADVNQHVLKLPFTTRGDSARYLSRHTASGSVFYAFDPQGNAVQQLNSSGNVIGAAMYDSYGAASSTNWGNRPFGYGAQFGYYTDAESGLCLLTYRYYSPAHASFLTRDPSGAKPNLYAYAKQNPVTGHDPSGLAEEKWVPEAPPHWFLHFDLIQCQIPGYPCAGKRHKYPIVSSSILLSRMGFIQGHRCLRDLGG